MPLGLVHAEEDRLSLGSKVGFPDGTTGGLTVGVQDVFIEGIILGGGNGSLVGLRWEFHLV